MKKIRLLASVIVIGSLCILSACGNKDASADTSTDTSVASQEDTSSTLKGTLENREYTIKEWLDSGQTCILYCEGADEPVPGKDEKPDWIYIFKDGTCSCYRAGWQDLTYGDLSKMTDDEIASYYEEKFLDEENKTRDYDFQNHSYEIAVYTDSTGNNVEYESIVTASNDEKSFEKRITHLMLNYVTGQATVYDSDYQVIVHKNNESTVWYRYGEDTIQKLNFDEMNTDGIMTDPDEDYGR